MKDQNTLRAMLKSEITWAVMFVMAVASFYRTVVIPINNLQIAVATLQQTLTDNNTRTAASLASLDARTTQNSNDIIKLQSTLTTKK